MRENDVQLPPIEIKDESGGTWGEYHTGVRVKVGNHQERIYKGWFCNWRVRRCLNRLIDLWCLEQAFAPNPKVTATEHSTMEQQAQAGRKFRQEVMQDNLLQVLGLNNLGHFP